MKWSLGISNFLEEISSRSHFVVFLYFFALIAEESFLIAPCYSLELCIQMGISFLFSLLFTSLLFSAICKASSDNHFAFFAFIFGNGFDHCLLYNLTDCFSPTHSLVGVAEWGLCGPLEFPNGNLLGNTS